MRARRGTGDALSLGPRWPATIDVVEGTRRLGIVWWFVDGSSGSGSFGEATMRRKRGGVPGDLAAVAGSSCTGQGGRGNPVAMGLEAEREVGGSAALA
ncbi:putative proline-rich receptor-like protein kinase PERK3 [Iris pallida]|uniref:Proline-rich receptor-like protein kinase PERK3 n=1 Tax=Iris pallida TaxID=29817 RepID=A0AAX6F279_IRIPA|nr:putative proline-rich receptor-like protein kinase PERK3 [Iris pallida]